MKEQDEWNSVKECPPTGNGRYLVTDGIDVAIGWYSVRHERFFDGDGVVVFAPIRVTHWMELPKPKKGG